MLMAVYALHWVLFVWIIWSYEKHVDRLEKEKKVLEIRAKNAEDLLEKQDILEPDYVFNDELSARIFKDRCSKK